MLYEVFLEFIRNAKGSKGIICRAQRIIITTLIRICKYELNGKSDHISDCYSSMIQSTSAV